VLVTVFRDACDVLLLDFLESVRTVQADMYCTALKILRKTVKTKFPVLPSERVIFLTDNSQLHTAQQTCNCCNISVGETFDCPPYGPNLGLRNFYLFPALKAHLSGHLFTCGKNMNLLPSRG
jgi:hypothetical protein